MQPASARDVTVLAAHASSFVVVRLAVQHRLIQPLMTNSVPIATRRMGVALVAASAFSLVVPRVAYAQAVSGTLIMRVTADSVPVQHVAVVTGSTGTVTDQTGAATFILPAGKHTFRVPPVGFRPETLTVFVGVGTTTISVPVHRASASSRQAAATKSVVS